MWLIIMENRSGEHEVSRRLAPNETLDCDHHMKRYLDGLSQDSGYDIRFDESDGYIPAGCGQYRCEIRNRKNDHVCIWSGTRNVERGNGRYFR